ncbi:efflux RND transporter periplasmic adaptor subunit [Methylovulum psychrotolerans]|uniref:Efflux RND transporter periplasmic adaptor subunit n=1 Tax=Methylovulum psychrotolerans TaxID=1704499 RepID=A0A1Z4BXX6_9GAMM|nr:efflux RND transporter periplasmic adaptor subunit [Methylovulum psychrotolerans]ASF46135.1 efflux transporter periplasmic adaptor subunit [Methylovulum psychrotolerans]POZ51882.1 efflux RND transporter periplasmic adaptor subunit [Methylovulum psychrotolerans]
MFKRMLIMLITVGVVLGGVFGFIEFKGRMIKQYMASQGEPPQTVSTITASYQDWLPKREAVASLRAAQGVEISSEVAGSVSAIHFKQGDNVAANTPLLQLRADDEIAKLNSLNATAELARITFRRSEAQFNAKAISQQTVDIDRANLNVALANVAVQQALIDKKTLRAPFSGQLGIRTIDAGQFLAAGTAITTLQNLDILYADFYLPQQDLAVLKTGQAVHLQTDAYPGEQFGGEISVIDPKVDSNSRNVLVRATFKNPNHRLLPGMYAKVQVVVGTPQPFITVPRTAISFNTFGATVFVVDEQKDDKGQPKRSARQALVTTGASRGDQISVAKGLNAGETVVTSGQIKLHNGSTVLIDNSQQPSNDPAPQPIDQ